jgi:putative transcriptional regulator
MAKMTERALRARDRKRDVGSELLASVREMKAGKVGHVHAVIGSVVTEAHKRRRPSR